MSKGCCRCPQELVPFLDRNVQVVTDCGTISGQLAAVGETFIEVREQNPNLIITIVFCNQICYTRVP